ASKILGWLISYIVSRTGPKGTNFAISSSPSIVKVELGVGLVVGRWNVDPLVAGDVAFERLERIGPELREAVQLELHEYARRRGARGEREPLQHEAGRPAVG